MHPIRRVLSKWEFKLPSGLVNGDDYTTIANDLFISPHNVKTNIKTYIKNLTLILDPKL